jgi:ubiquinone/menaquinone biosynthesis C-methylase UbiE
VGVDASPSLLPPLGNSTRLSLQDVDAMPAAIREIERILQLGGRSCFAIVHPMNSV